MSEYYPKKLRFLTAAQYDALPSADKIRTDVIYYIKGDGGGSGGIPDAPSDGKTYGRKDAAWTEVTSGSPVISCTTPTAAATPAKVITLEGYTPAAGDMLAVTFTLGNTANSPTLNINGTGAKPIKIGGKNPTGGGNTGGINIAATGVGFFYYDGTNFNQLGNLDITDENTTYAAMTQAEIDAGTGTTSRSIAPKLLVDNFAKKSDVPAAYTLPQAGAELGGVKADAAQVGDTQPVRIGADGKLVTAPGGGGGEPPEIASQAEATAGINNTKMMTPLRVKQSIVANAPGGSGGSDPNAVKFGQTVDLLLMLYLGTELPVTYTYQGSDPAELTYDLVLDKNTEDEMVIEGSNIVSILTLGALFGDEVSFENPSIEDVSQNRQFSFTVKSMITETDCETIFNDDLMMYGLMMKSTSFMTGPFIASHKEMPVTKTNSFLPDESSSAISLGETTLRAMPYAPYPDTGTSWSTYRRRVLCGPGYNDLDNDYDGYSSMPYLPYIGRKGDVLTKMRTSTYEYDESYEMEWMPFIYDAVIRDQYDFDEYIVALWASLKPKNVLIYGMYDSNGNPVPYVCDTGIGPYEHESQHRPNSIHGVNSPVIDFRGEINNGIWAVKDVRNITVKTFGYGFYGCENLYNCKAYAKSRIAIYAQTVRLFSSCDVISGCKAYLEKLLNLNSTQIAFYFCNDITNCAAVSISEANAPLVVTTTAFDSCYRLTNCNTYLQEADSGTSVGKELVGYASCRALSNCMVGIASKNLLGYGFKSCNMLSSCYAQFFPKPDNTNTLTAYKDIKCAAACLKSDNSVWAGANTLIDSDSCDGG